jgi:hypothetical protein
MGDININVAGNLDKVGLKDIQNSLLQAANSIMQERGKRTNVFNKSI